MPGAQKMIDVDESGLRELAQRLALDHHQIAPHDAFDPNALPADLAIAGRVFGERKQRRVAIGRHDLGRRVHAKLQADCDRAVLTRSQAEWKRPSSLRSRVVNVFEALSAAAATGLI